jgi:hypothetical protein
VSSNAISWGRHWRRGGGGEQAASTHALPVLDVGVQQPTVDQLRAELRHLAMAVELLSSHDPTSIGTCSITAITVYIFEHVPMEVGT